MDKIKKNFRLLLFWAASMCFLVPEVLGAKRRPSEERQPSSSIPARPATAAAAATSASGRPSPRFGSRFDPHNSFAVLAEEADDPPTLPRSAPSARAVETTPSKGRQLRRGRPRSTSQPSEQSQRKDSSRSLSADSKVHRGVQMSAAYRPDVEPEPDPRAMAYRDPYVLFPYLRDERGRLYKKIENGVDASDPSAVLRQLQRQLAEERRRLDDHGTHDVRSEWYEQNIQAFMKAIRNLEMRIAADAAATTSAATATTSAATASVPRASATAEAVTNPVGADDERLAALGTAAVAAAQSAQSSGAGAASPTSSFSVIAWLRSWLPGTQRTP